MKAKSALFWVSLAELFGISVWFTSSAIAPMLQQEFGLSNGQIAGLIIAVQFGFVIGTLGIALTNLADILNTRRLFAFCSCLAAVSNLMLLWSGSALAVALLFRFVTGMALAGVYPPGMKIIAGWYRSGRGLAIGTMIGAVTLGSALPHWIGSLLQQEWRWTIAASSVLALVAAAVVALAVKDGPFDVQARKFNFKYAVAIFKYRPTRLAYLGYFGHMWELYAMWTWLPVFLAESFADRTKLASSAGFLVFAVIGSGAVGCVLYGLWADRIGRSLSTIIAMAISAICCFTAGHLSPYPLALVGVCFVWGITIVADSGQFSTAMSELCDPQYLGTALTLQTCIGFLITMLSIRLIPPLKASIGWPWAFSVLGLGPLAGIVAMAALYRLPQAVQMAQGRR